MRSPAPVADPVAVDANAPAHLRCPHCGGSAQLLAAGKANDDRRAYVILHYGHDGCPAVGPARLEGLSVPQPRRRRFPRRRAR